MLRWHLCRAAKPLKIFSTYEDLNTNTQRHLRLYSKAMFRNKSHTMVVRGDVKTGAAVRYTPCCHAPYSALSPRSARVGSPRFLSPVPPHNASRSFNGCPESGGEQRARAKGVGGDIGVHWTRKLTPLQIQSKDIAKRRCGSRRRGASCTLLGY